MNEPKIGIVCPIHHSRFCCGRAYSIQRVKKMEIQSRLSEAERLLERAEKFIYGVSQNKSFFGHEQKLSAQELLAEIKKFREGEK